VDFPSSLRRGSSLPRVVTFVDNCEVEKIAAKREVEMLNGPLFERCRFEGRKLVDCDGNSRDWRNRLERAEFLIAEPNLTWIPRLDYCLRV
jgi:hypothetical protein